MHSVRHLDSPRRYAERRHADGGRATGDETTGETIARGNAELTIAARAVRARADEIAIRPGRNEVTFTGKALVFAGDKRFESEAVVCSLDFLRCTDAMTVPPPVQAEAVPQPAAATTP